MTNPLRQKLKAPVTVDLTVIDYPQGSYVKGIVNPTRAWHKAWREEVTRLGVKEIAQASMDVQELEARFEVADAEDMPAIREELQAASDRLDELERTYRQQARDRAAELLPLLYIEVVITNEDGEQVFYQRIEGPEDVAVVDDIDPRIFTMSTQELFRRAEEGVHTAGETFRRIRDERIEAAQHVRRLYDTGPGADGHSDGAVK